MLAAAALPHASSVRRGMYLEELFILVAFG